MHCTEIIFYNKNNALIYQITIKIVIFCGFFPDGKIGDAQGLIDEYQYD